MTGLVHALLGAGLGGLAGGRWRAFCAGLVSHAVGDAIPHSERPALLDAALTAGVLGVMALRYGSRSPQVAGALGGLSPDAEHGASKVGLIADEQKLFPTHRDGSCVPHGRKTNNHVPQVLLACAGIAVAELASRRRSSGA
jgi:hypothetical protein